MKTDPPALVTQEEAEVLARAAAIMEAKSKQVLAMARERKGPVWTGMLMSLWLLVAAGMTKGASER